MVLKEHILNSNVSTEGSLVVNYPYDDDKEGISHYSKAPDDQVFQQLSRAYSQVTKLCCCCCRRCICFRAGREQSFRISVVKTWGEKKG